jgi:predicted nucleic acid-binding protein
MASAGYLMDSNIIINYLSENLETAQLDYLDNLFSNILFVSIITKMEVLGYSMPEEIESVFKEFIGSTEVLYIDDKIVDRTISLRKELKIKLPDAIITATAIVNQIPLVTFNAKDFEKIKDIQVIVPVMR